MRIHYFQHVPFEKPGSIEGWSIKNGHVLSATRFYQGEPPPEVSAIDWLIVMGGPMNIYEEAKYPWLVPEKKFIEQAIQEGKVVIGICLGAQLIADVLGAKIYQSQYKEIGWFPIHLTAEAKASPLLSFLPHKIYVFHWHGDTFELPTGAIRLAQSEACYNQAFIYHETVLALQFHLEVSLENIQQIIAHCGSEIREEKYIQRPEKILSYKRYFREVHKAIHGILDRLSA